MARSPEQYFDTVVAPHLKDSVFKDDFLSVAAELIGPRYYRQFTNYAIALMAAHQLTLAGLDPSAGGRLPGQAGAVAGIKESELQVTYYLGAAAQKNGMIGYLDQTSYGIQLKDLRRVANLPITATGCVDNLEGNPVRGVSGGIVF